MAKKPTAKTDLQLAYVNMTPIQRRRYKYYIKGWSLTKIARKEGVSVNSVKKSIKSAQKRAKKRLRGLKRGCTLPIYYEGRYIL